VQLHEWRQIQDRSLKHVGLEILNDPMLNHWLECDPLFEMGFCLVTVGRHYHQAVLLQVIPFLLVQLVDFRAQQHHLPWLNIHLHQQKPRR
jgi:hypothetical protein